MKKVKKTAASPEPLQPTAKAIDHPARAAITMVRPDPNQPRKEFDPVKLRELAGSIKEQGIVHKLLVVYVPGLRVEAPDLVEPDWKAVEDVTGRVVATGAENTVRTFVKGKDEPYYMIVDGERRWRAAQLLKLSEVPIDCRQLSEEQIRNIQLISAMQRENLSALEEAAAFQRELDLRRQTDTAFNPEKLGAELGKTRSTIYNRLALLKLHEPVKQALEGGAIDVTVAGLVAQIPDRQLQIEALKQASGSQWERPKSFREMAKLIDEKYIRTLNPKLFHLDKAYEGKIDGRKEGCDLQAIGTCEKCPRRSGNMKDTFPDIKNPNVCTDPPCFEAKKVAAVGRRLEQAKNEGQRVMDSDTYRRNRDKTVQATDTCYEDSKYRNWGELMGKQAEQPIAVEHDGELIEVWPKDEAREAAKKNGIKLGHAASAGGNATYLKKQKKKKKLVKVCQYATGLVLDRMVFKKGLDERLWKNLAEKLNHWASIDAQAFVAKRRGLAKVVGEVRNGLDKWFKQKRTVPEYQAFIAETLLCSGAVGNWDPRISKDFKELCGMAKVDLAECEKAVDAGHTGIAVQTELVPVPETKKPKKK